MSEQIEKLIQEWRSGVDEYAKANADKNYLTEFRKSKKAILMAEAQEKGEKVKGGRLDLSVIVV